MLLLLLLLSDSWLLVAWVSSSVNASRLPVAQHMRLTLLPAWAAVQRRAKTMRAPLPPASLARVQVSKQSVIQVTNKKHL